MNQDDIKFVIDVETTGLDYKKEKIIELAAIKLVNNQITETFSSLVNPMQHIKPSSISIHNITEEMILQAPTIEEILPSLLDFISDKPIIGHNIIFDYSFINEASLMLYGRGLSNERIDTLTMFKEVFPDERSHGLAALLARFDLSYENTHRAYDDAHNLAQVYDKLYKLYQKRYQWELLQKDNIDYLLERYLRVQSVIQTLQAEMGDIKSVFKLYFDNGGKNKRACTGELLTYTSKQSYQYDMDKLREIVKNLDGIDRITKINTGAIDKLIANNSFPEDVKNQILGARVNITENRSVNIIKPQPR